MTTVTDHDPKPQPWWRLDARLRWLLGWERGSLEVEAFTETIYAQALGTLARNAALQPVVDRLQCLRSRPDFAAAMACEQQLYEALTPDDWRAGLWSLRERFGRVASPSALAAFTAAQVDPKTASDAALIGEVRTLLSYTHKSYELTNRREVAARRLKAWLLGLTVGAIVLFSMLVYRFSATLDISAPRSLAFGIGALVLSGSAGAVMSVARRLQGAIDDKVLDRDPLFEIAALELGRVGILLSCLIGAIFSLLAYAIILAGLGALLGDFGSFLLPRVGRGAMLGHATGISHALGFRGDLDAAKMLVIAFVAGFAERLIPDAIDRILKQKETPTRPAAPPAK